MEAIDRLIQAFAASGLKQTHVADVTGIGTTRLSRILNRKQIPTVPEYIAIARAIRHDPGRLFTDGDLVVDLQTLRDAHATARHLLDTLAKLLPETASAPASPFAKKEPSHDAVPVGAAADPNAELIADFETTPQRIPRRAWSRGARIIARAVGESMDGRHRSDSRPRARLSQTHPELARGERSHSAHPPRRRPLPQTVREKRTAHSPRQHESR